ncbi:lysR substrate binding domain protein [Ochrobactrum quorumnocens]|uniref:LysR substrate binding domain protein n=1 Tax=Ochrobactrum quorumnocens TaxID=271865 RepID=A0A248UC87_9HYPH|nr:LysR family transcriptional regulator [[Ochrobactrum] quorumnocens]ASV84433.1 lysR substrate binding domain protein [[Ochrobactrum] quorumnocens]
MKRIFASQTTLHKLEIFCTVCELQSVTRTAERMSVAQPVVTAHLRFLEDKLGVKLFERSGRRLVLTAAGRRVHTWANEVITRTRELERELNISGEAELGTAIVSASMTVASYVLPPLFSVFRQNHPTGGVTLLVSNPQLVTASVRDGSCDFGVCILDPRHDVDGLNVERLWIERLVLVTAAGSTLAGETVSPEEIAALPFVSSPRNQVRRELEEDALRAHGIIGRQVVLELGHPEAMKQAVRAHAGVAFVMETSVRDECERGLLRRIATPGVDLSVPVFLVSRRDKSFSDFQSSLMDFVRDSAVGGQPPVGFEVSDVKPPIR